MIIQYCETRQIIVFNSKLKKTIIKVSIFIYIIALLNFFIFIIFTQQRF